MRHNDSTLPPPLPPPALPPPPPPPPPAKVRLGNVNLPFFSGVTEPLARILTNKGLSTSISTRGSIRETLVHPKDKLQKEETNGHIYHIPCAGANSIPCPGTYIGETERTAGARFQEHTSTATNALGKYKSAMLQHAREHNHHFRKEDLSILASDHDWIKRGIKEAIFIQTLKPSINIDPGRHKLSSHFDTILGSILKTPPAPPTHDASAETIISTAPRRQGRPRKETTAPKTVAASQPEQQPQQQSPQPSQLQQHSQQQQGSSSTRPKTMTSPAQGLRQSQRLRDRQQQQQQQQQLPGGHALSGLPQAAP